MNKENKFEKELANLKVNLSKMEGSFFNDIIFVPMSPNKLQRIINILKTLVEGRDVTGYNNYTGIAILVDEVKEYELVYHEYKRKRGLLIYDNKADKVE